MIGSRCCGQTFHMTQSILTVNGNVSRIITGIANRLYFSKDKGEKCCENVPQTAGKKIEPWPKSDSPPPAWRYECPTEPQPPNYDPYRIKVPDVVVPPMPPSNAKEIPSEDAGELFNNAEMNFQSEFPSCACRVQDLFHNTPFVHPDYWKDKPVKPLTEAVKEVLPKLGYHGRNKYKYAFHEPWKPLDRITLLEQAEKQELEQLDEATGDTQQTKEQTT